MSVASAQVLTAPTYVAASPNPPPSTEERLRQLEQQLQRQRWEYDQLKIQVDGQQTVLVERLDALADEKTAEKKDDKKDAAKADEGYVVGSDLGMTANWKDGLELSTKNKDFRVHVGGRTQLDAGWFSTDPNLYTAAGAPTAGLGNVYGDGADFRRARLRVDGTMYEQIDWAAEYDFVNSAALGADSAAGPGHLSNQPRALTAPTDLWFTFKMLPVLGNVRVGNHKAAIGFEHLVSSRFQPFMERSFNGFLPGISAYDTYGGDDQIGTWNVGLFKPTNNVFAFNTGDGDYNVTGRLTRVWWWADEGRGLLHTGISGQAGTAVGQAVGSNGSQTPARSATFRTRDAIRTGLSADWPTPANITVFGDDMQTLNAELVGVYGRWTFQSEYLVNWLHDSQARSGATGLPTGPVVGDLVYHGGYVQLLYFLTNDHDHYDKKVGFFERVRPHENFFRVRDENGGIVNGRGAWQTGVRYNYLDLNDNGLNGGVLHNFTYGLNWFLNPNRKLQFNYIKSFVANPTFGHSDANMFGARAQIDF
jgi:phosphate-selective porin OprO/OprP